MENHFTEDHLFNALRLLRERDTRLFLVVEGESDVRSLENHINSDDCDIVVGYGKKSILGAMGRLEVIDDKSVGLVDRDFGDLVDETIPKNVFTTCLYDREADILLRANMISQYVGRLYNRRQVIQQCRKLWDTQQIVSLIVDIATTIGRVRWSSIRDQLGLNLSKFPIGEVARYPGTVQEADVIDIAVKRSPNHRVDVESVKQACLVPIPIGAYDLCNGHDLVGALAVSSQWWAYDRVGSAEIERFLVAGLRCDMLVRLPWFRRLEAWAVARERLIWNCPHCDEE